MRRSWKLYVRNLGNRHHFVRNSEFEGAAEKLDPETRELFVDFLEGSCTSEFSGFLLYKELSKRIKVKNPWPEMKLDMQVF